MDEKKSEYSLIATIINRGFSDDVMDAARDAGARGGTVVYAHGTGLHEGNGFFGLSIHPEKELILILADEEHRKEIMQAIVRHNGLSTEGAGITFSLPVTNVAGIANINSHPDDDEPEKTE